MKDVRTNKNELRLRVQTNRDGHRAEYEKAIEGYRKTVIEWFNEQINKAKSGKAYETYFSMPKPEDHTKDYDQILDMIDMEEEDVITLTNQEFRQYVRDEWGWMQEFKATSANYVR
jgi:hypothetical protein